MSIEKKYLNKIDEIIFNEQEIINAIIKAAEWINNQYKDTKETLVIIGLLKGCIPFLGQLLTKINVEMILDFMVVSSFKGKDKAQGLPEIVVNIVSDIKDKNVLFVEDIIDSGYTIKYVMELLSKQNPKSMKVITLIDKPSGRKTNINADYSCFKIDDKFIVGYGLDYKEECRNYNLIGVLKKELINGEKNENMRKNKINFS